MISFRETKAVINRVERSVVGVAVPKLDSYQTPGQDIYTVTIK